jgi:hypothetical protein
MKSPHTPKMKTMIQFQLIAALLFITGSLSAQSLRWAYTNQFAVLDSAADGFGGYAQCEFGTGTNDFAGRAVWLAPNGNVLLIHDFELNSENGWAEIVRLTPSELAIHIYPRRAPGEAPLNLLRRFKRTGNKFTIVDKALGEFETLPRVEDKFTDRFGFFTFENNVVRRYSN